MIRTEEEINEQIDLAMEGREDGTNFAGMSYEDGVITALEWLNGDCDEKPMDE